MLLSIVIPTHNRFAYLQRCLEALCAEAPRTLDCEITVIDDGSRADIAEKNKALCREKGVGYYYDEQNAGAAAARNRGIEISNGEWVAFIDDDVCVETGWGIRCEEILRTIPADVAGIEGRVIATGSGVWDREVENTKGALYLSCHIFYRKETLDAAGKFDEHFSSRYPSCEDHELAVRVRLRGDIIFAPGLCVRHLPRKVNLPRYCWDSFYRMRSLLDAELYFFLKHRDRYHTARHATSFWGTYRNIIIRHLYSTVKRRRFSMLAKHPPQSVALLISCALEQAYALLVVPKIFRRYQSNPYQFFRQRMNEDRTRDAWKIAADSSVTALALKPRFLRSLLFRLLRSPVYSIEPFLPRIRRESALVDLRIFLRIDDVFIKNASAIPLLCEKLGNANIPYCAGITGDDLIHTGAESLVRLILQSGGRIALHGFTHAGRFGPFNSEVLQMNFRELAAGIEKVLLRIPASLKPKIFIPPFNAINRDQIVYLGKYFHVICGGPETARFTDYFTGPVALEHRAWYFPSFHPLYDSARNILKSGVLKNISGKKGFLCITVHLPAEAEDDFATLMTMIDRVRDNMTSWEYFYPSSHGERELS